MNKILLNVKEVAEILNCAENSLRVWLCKGKVIPKRLIVRLGRKTLFNKEELINWVQSGCKFVQNEEGEIRNEQY